MQREDVELPERIWAAAAKQGYGEWQDLTDGLPRPVEYVRADLYAALLAERDALQGQLNDLRNGWANSVKAHADALAERDALDAIASKLQHDHDMMALANGKLEAERDAAFVAGQEEVRERAVAAARKRKVDITDNYTCAWTTCAVRILDELQALPIKDSPE